jgi:hypothetical protein
VNDDNPIASIPLADCAVRMKRPGGLIAIIRVPGEHWSELVDQAAREFGQ